jgi:hypothetical protein
MGERVRTLALVVCLLLLATILAGLSAGLPPSAVHPTTVREPALGTLLVKADMDQGTNNATSDAPIANASVSISRIGSLSLLPLVFRTNSSGEFTISFVTGDYSVSVSDSQFKKDASVVVQENMTTEVDVTVIRNSYPTLFSDLPDPDSSGSVAPWSYVYVAVSSSLGLPLNDSLFLDGAYGTYVYFFSSNATSTESGNLSLGSVQPQIALVATPASQAEERAALISSSFDTSSSHLLWLTLQPESFLSLFGLVSLSLATYTTELQVTTHAT